VISRASGSGWIRDIEVMGDLLETLLVLETRYVQVGTPRLSGSRPTLQIVVLTGI